MVKYILFIITLVSSTALLAETMYDPTKPGWSAPVTGEAPAVQKPMLTAIVISGNHRKALIGETYYVMGDYFQGRRIISIEFDQVRLVGESGQVTMTLVKKITSETKSQRAKSK